MKPMISVIAAALGAAALHAAPAAAQAYPSKTVRIIVPLAPGGGNDTIARMMANKISPALGQQIVVDNRPGAGGMIAAEMVARAAPDGYTLLLGNVGVMAIIPNMQAKVPYDPVKDFQPVSLIASAPLLVVVHPSLPVASMKQLVALAKTRPGQINYASNGIGSSTHLATEMFTQMAGIKLVHVPYKGLSLAMTDILSGQVPLMFSSAVAMLPHVKNGKLRAIAMTGAVRSKAIPDIPTVAEAAGLREYEAGSWYGIVAPAGTPRPVVDRLHREIAAAVKSPDIGDRLQSEAVIPSGGTPEQFSAHIAKELKHMADVIKRGGIQAN
jgi:tripartite-type tricarboxylate transporter receptor subunit TctC